MNEYAGQERDFTETHYREILGRAQRNYVFSSFTARPSERKHILWRHDIDVSPHRARALARIEAELGVASTFFVLLHSEMYNALEVEVVRILREITAFGHHIGLHFDPGFYGESVDFERALAMERDVLRTTLNVPVDCFSWHNPSLGNWMDAVTQNELAGMVNVYGAEIRTAYTYVSDSHGVWRFRRLYDVVETAEETALHVLTHAEWWVEEPMPPRDRMTRAIEGRAQRSHRFYDEAIAAMGRPNVR